MSDADRELRKITNTASDSYDKMRDSAGKLRAEEEKLKQLRKDEASDDRIVVQAEKVEKARRAEARATRDAATAYNEYQRAVDRRERDKTAAQDAITQSINSQDGAIRSLSLSMGALGKVGGALGIATAIPVIAQMAGAVSTLSGALGALPAVTTAAGTAIGTLALGTAGFGDAIKNIGDPEEFAESIKQLSPNARDAAVSIRELMPELRELQQVTQDALFGGVGPQLESLTDALLPTVRNVTTGVAGGLNAMFRGAADQLMDPTTMAQLDALGDNLTATFYELSGVAAPLTQSFVQLSEVGSQFLPQMAQGAASAADEFARWIDELAASGELQQWIEDGLVAARQLGPAVKAVGTAFYELGETGKAAMPEIVQGVENLADALPEIVELAAELGPSFADAAGAIQLFGNTAAPVLAGVNKYLGDTLSLATALPNLLEISGLIEGDRRGPFGADLRTLQEKIEEALAAQPGRNYTAPTPGVYRGVGQNNIPLPDSAGRVYEAGVPGVYRPGANNNRGLGPLESRNGYGLSEAGRGGAPALPDAPVLPQTYTPLVPGAPSQIINAQERIDEANHSLAEKRARLTQLESVNVATAEDIQKARNDVIEAERDTQDAERGMVEARRNAFESQTRQLNQQSSQLGEIGAQLDQDFGISRGLAGIAENITKFVANLAAAPLLGPLAAIRDAYGGTQGGGGLVGIAGALSGFGIGGGGSSGGGSYGMSYFTGMPVGAGGAPSEAQVRQIAAQFGLEVTSALRPGDSGYHGQGMALDLSNGGANTPEMEAFARYMAQNFGSSLKELIYTDPDFSGSQIKDGQFTPDSTYGAVAGEHENHVHIAADWGSGGGGMPGAGSGFPWDVVAQFESGNNWANADTGNNGHWGGLQFSPSTWNAFGGQQFAPMPHLATREQQMAIADNTAFYGYNGTSPQGLGAWEVITNGSTSPYGITTGSQPPGGPSGGPMMPGTGFPQAAPFGSGTPFVSGLGDLPMGVGGADPGNTLIGGIGWPTGGAGGSGAGGGGVLGGLMSGAAGAGGMALDAMAPGAGTATSIATQIAIQEINRAIKYGGQVVGIGVQGLMETFLPVGASETAANSWITRIAGGLAGAAPQLPNMAGGGKKGELMPKQQAELDQGRGPLSPAQAAAHQAGQATNNINSGNQTINVDATDRNTGSEIGRDVQYETNVTPVTGP